MRLDGVSKQLLVVSAEEAIGVWLHDLLRGAYGISLLRIDDSLEERIQESASSIDLMLLAIHQHDDSCQELLRGLHKASEPCQAPIIVVTDEEASSDWIVSALEAGAQDVVSRTRGTALLMARVKAVLADCETIDAYRRRIAELTESDNLRLQSLRMAAHDLKTPINNVRIAESILRLTAPKRQEVAQSLNMIRLMVANMNDIINDFIGLFEVRAGQMRIQLGPIHLPEVIKEIVNDFEYAAAQKQIHLRNRIEDGCVIGDATRLKQAVGNLLSNAIKYSPSDAEVKIYAFGRANCIYIMVEDQGAGIPQKEREEIFRMSGKLTPRPTAGESSTGLGLWIVDQVMKAQNGNVGADFPESGGSRFWVSLPEIPARDDSDTLDAGERSARAYAAHAVNPTGLVRTDAAKDSEDGG